MTPSPFCTLFTTTEYSHDWSGRCRRNISVRVWIKVSVRVGLLVLGLRTAGESDKLGISHVIKTDQWRSDPKIRSAPDFVVSPQYCGLDPSIDVCAVYG